MEYPGRSARHGARLSQVDTPYALSRSTAVSSLQERDLWPVRERRVTRIKIPSPWPWGRPAASIALR